MRSLWLEDTSGPGYTSDVREADVVVVGAGLTGMLTAWRLLDQGRSVIVLEARRVGTGTSGHTTGKITSQHALCYRRLIDRFGVEGARIYAESNQWAVGAYRELVTELDLPCHLETRSAYVYTDDDPEALEKELAATLELGLPAALESVPVSPHPALAFHDQAQFHPHEFLVGLARRFVEAGGVLVEDARVTEVDREDDRTRLETPAGSFRAPDVVFATLFPLFDRSLFSLRLQPVQHFGMAFHGPPGQFDGMFIGTSGPSFRSHGDLLVVVGASEAMGRADGSYEKLERQARERLEITDEVTRWSAHDLVSPDRVPLIGTFRPGSDRRFTATGFGAWGVTPAMVAARILPELIAGREHPWAELYSPWRAGGVVRQAAEQAATAVRHLVRGKPRCPHMGCALSYNSEDSTWDCPCHGSRFDAEGRVLWGPAVQPADLEGG